MGRGVCFGPDRLHSDQPDGDHIPGRDAIGCHDAELCTDLAAVVAGLAGTGSRAADRGTTYGTV